MQDRERGVVWEEIIIFLPKEVKMVFLSATLSNASQFAAWVAHLRKQPCHVVYTDYRPTPLQHYGFPVGGNGLFLVCPLTLAGLGISQMALLGLQLAEMPITLPSSPYTIGLLSAASTGMSAGTGASCVVFQVRHTYRGVVDADQG